MKRLLSLVLSAIIAIGLMPAGFAVAEEERRVLTIGGLSSSATFLEFDYYKKLQDDLNITIEYIPYTDDGFSAMLAGGDLPDIVRSSERLDIVLGSKLALNLEPYLDRLPSLTTPLYSATLELTRELYGGEERGVYILCPVVGKHVWNGGTYMVERGYSVNWEYYKELGCPSFSNDDEYIEILKQMQANHPTGDDGLPTYLWLFTES